MSVFLSQSWLITCLPFQNTLQLEPMLTNLASGDVDLWKNKRFPTPQCQHGHLTGICDNHREVPRTSSTAVFTTEASSEVVSKAASSPIRRVTDELRASHRQGQTGTQQMRFSIDHILHRSHPNIWQKPKLMYIYNTKLHTHTHKQSLNEYVSFSKSRLPKSCNNRSNLMSMYNKHFTLQITLSSRTHQHPE